MIFGFVDEILKLLLNCFLNYKFGLLIATSEDTAM